MPRVRSKPLGQCGHGSVVQEHVSVRCDPGPVLVAEDPIRDGCLELEVAAKHDYAAQVSRLESQELCERPEVPDILMKRILKSVLLFEMNRCPV
jgi:hypothetical protein